MHFYKRRNNLVCRYKRIKMNRKIIKILKSMIILDIDKPIFYI